MSSVVFVNLFTDMAKEGENRWLNYSAPELLKDFFCSKGIDSEFINLDELVAKCYFSESFYKKVITGLKKDIFEYENKEILAADEFVEYISMKFILERVDGGRINILESVNGSITKLPDDAEVMMKYIDIFQAGKIKIEPTDADYQNRLNLFEMVMNKTLQEYDFNNKLIVFSIPTKAYFSSAIATGRIIKKMFPKCKIVIGGSYIKLVSISMLDELVERNIIDLHIQDSSEGKLLSLGRDFILSKTETCRGAYDKEEHVDINELIKTTKSSTFNNGIQTIMLSRGCYWGRCTFCEYPHINPEYSVKKPKVVVDEIEGLMKQGVSQFRLVTDCIIPSVGAEIAKEILARNLKIKWHTGFMRIDPRYTKEVFLIMKESGFLFEKVTIGMESCIDSCLAKINKGYNRKIIEKWASTAKEAGVVFFKINVIYDIPGTTWEDALETFRYSLELLDISKTLSGGFLYLSEYCDMGKNPEKYGIKFTGYEPLAKWRDSLLFEMETEISGKNKEVVEKFYWDMLRIYEATCQYPYLDSAELARTGMYDERKMKLMVKTGKKLIEIKSLFNERGEKQKTSYYIPEQAKLVSLFAISFLKEMNKLEQDTWYSIGEIVELIGYNSQMEKSLLLQKLFRSVVVVLGWHGFDDAKVERIENA